MILKLFYSFALVGQSVFLDYLCLSPLGLSKHTCIQSVQHISHVLVDSYYSQASIYC